MKGHKHWQQITGKFDRLHLTLTHFPFYFMQLNGGSWHTAGGTDVISLLDATITGGTVVNAAARNTYCYAVNIMALLKAWLESHYYRHNPLIPPWPPIWTSDQSDYAWHKGGRWIKVSSLHGCWNLTCLPDKCMLVPLAVNLLSRISRKGSQEDSQC